MKTQESASRLLNDIQAMKGKMKEAWSSIREKETWTAAGVRAPKKNALMCNEYLRKKSKTTKGRRQRSCGQRPRPKHWNQVAGRKSLCLAMFVKCSGTLIEVCECEQIILSRFHCPLHIPVTRKEREFP